MNRSSSRGRQTPSWGAGSWSKGTWRQPSKGKGGKVGKGWNKGTDDMQQGEDKAESERAREERGKEAQDDDV